MAAHNDLGKFGEKRAAEYIESLGLYIRHQDWNCGHTDLDIVAIDEFSTTLYFIEVKTRRTDRDGDPREAVDYEKAQNILRAATQYARHFHLEQLEKQFDIITVIGDDDRAQVRHYQKAIDSSSTYAMRNSEYKSRPTGRRNKL